MSRRFPALLTALLLTLGSPPARADGLDDEVHRFIECLQKGEFVSATARFNPTIQKGLSPEKLGEIWKQVTGAFGPLASTGEPHRQTLTAPDGKPATLVTVRLKFQHGELDARVSFSGDGQINGLHFMPADAGVAPAAAPPYAKRERFRETEVQVGAPGFPLGATLATPEGEGPFPAVVLVHGSGPEDRDESIFACKVFRDLAWGLASRGVAVLRYDKRTLAHGDAWSDRCTIEDETIADAVTACAVLRASARIDPARVYVVGHSLGAMVAPEIARRAGASGAVLLAAAARRLEDVILAQNEAAVMEDGKASAEELDAVQSAWDSLDGTPGAAAGIMSQVYLRSLDALNPVDGARALGKRVLVLQGGRDFQVSPVLDFLRFRRALAGVALVETRFYPTLNHLFTAGEGKSTLDEYKVAKNVDEAVVTDIAEWVLETRKAGK